MATEPSDAPALRSSSTFETTRAATSGSDVSSQPISVRSSFPVFPFAFDYGMAKNVNLEILRNGRSDPSIFTEQNFSRDLSQSLRAVADFGPVCTLLKPLNIRQTEAS
jgi:hypothetical protein